MGGAGSGLGGVAVVLAEEDGGGEKEGDHEEAGDRGDDGLLMTLDLLHMLSVKLIVLLAGSKDSYTKWCSWNYSVQSRS
ncbi:hypothetical protein glysoja_044532 [Glycine soja]|uniref:Uncharacterized protein n=1 Tax=Glycine soja TaxID=3848 RepID=A0A0B2R980_GLYSO|nr:hypothetical protein glysoja_044532 [Glycine soja]